MNYIVGYADRANTMLLERGYRRIRGGYYVNANNVSVRTVNSVEQLAGAEGNALALGADSSAIRSQSLRIVCYTDAVDFFAAAEA